MIEVDAVKLKNDILRLKQQIDEYEEILLNLFNQLKDSCINWHDDNSMQYESQIEFDRKEANQLLELYRSEKDIYEYIYNEYYEIGKKVKCNLNNRATLLRIISDCISQADSVIRSLNNTGGYGITGTVSSVRNSLSELKDLVTKLYDRIEAIEKEVNSKIKELEELKIHDFEFQLI